jgi:hypothetical protein
LAQRRAIGILAAGVVAVILAGGIVVAYRLRRTQPLPAGELLKIEVQLEAGAGTLKAHVANGSDYRLQDVTVRVVALRPSVAASQSTDSGGWQIATSWCTFDPVTKPDGYDKAFDRQIRFRTTLEPTAMGEADTASNFVPGSDYWECRIVSADGRRH